MCDIAFIHLSMYTQLQFARVAPPVLELKLVSCWASVAYGGPASNQQRLVFSGKIIVVLKWDNNLVCF